MVRSLVVAFASVGLVGCATGPRPIAARPAAVAQNAVDSSASGTWDWTYTSNDDQGDERVEQEEWHLEQRGGRIQGHYDRKVTMLSTDERLFRCNQRLGFAKVTRVHIAGQVLGNRVLLREVGFQTKPGPCDDGQRNLVEYAGTVDGEKLMLKWGPEAGQTLLRRTDGGRAPLFQASELTGEPAGTRLASNSGPSSSAEVAGTWEWELRSIDPEGDERSEREEWHLTETADGVSGYYDRTVKKVRGEGVYTCGDKKVGATTSTTRYQVRGQRFGERLMLREVDYQVDDGNPCENGKRRLDKYNGQIADADSLVLSWGPGNQILRRKR